MDASPPGPTRDKRHKPNGGRPSWRVIATQTLAARVAMAAILPLPELRAALVRYAHSKLAAALEDVYSRSEDLGEDAPVVSASDLLSGWQADLTALTHRLHALRDAPPPQRSCSAQQRNGCRLYYSHVSPAVAACA